MVDNATLNFYNKVVNEVKSVGKALTAQNLLNIRKQANEARKELNADLAKKGRIKDAIQQEILDRFFSVYDTACALYYCGGVDKQIFKRQFYKEIENLVNGNLLTKEEVNKYSFLSEFIAKEIV
jgi:hypothetical protein